MTTGSTTSADASGFLSLFRGGLQNLLNRPAGNVGVLDLLRSAAILLVFGSHFGDFFSASPTIHRFPLFVYGWSGVDLFFVLSGLLIGTQLWRELNETGHIQISRFLLRRGARIWPLYFSFVLLFVFLIPLAHRPSTGIWADLFCVSNYVQGQLIVGWSLSTEEQFYILAPLLLIALAAINIEPRQRWIFPALALLILPVARAITIYAAPATASGVPDWRTLYFPIHTHADGLAIGLLLAYGVVFRPDLIASKRFRWIASCFLIIAGVGLSLLSRPIFNFTTLAFCFGAATLCGLGLQGMSSVWNWRGFYLTSRLSYGIYLNHFWILRRFASLADRWHVGAGPLGLWICFVPCLLISMVIAVVTFQVIEWPFLRLRARWQASANREKPISPAEAPAIAVPVALPNASTD